MGQASAQEPGAPNESRANGDVRSETPLQFVDTVSAADTGYDDEHELPEQIGRFRILQFLGSGGFAHVYLAHDPELDRPVALKVSRHGQVPSESRAAEIQREARIAARLQHSHIVTIYDVGRTEEHGVYIAMEYLSGPTLARHLDQHRPTMPDIVRILARIAEAIHFSHKQGVIHRDLKPSNILFTESGVPKVSDFGLALHEEVQHERRGDVSGTPSYMSPEQARGETHRLDGRSDIWSLGVILYQCLSGRLPFQGQSNADVYDEIEHRAPKPLRQIDDRIPPALDELCRQCLSKQPADRPASALDVARRLEEALGSTPRQSRPWWAAIAAAALLIGIVATGAATWRRGSNDLPPGPAFTGGANLVSDDWSSQLQEAPRRLVFDSATPTNIVSFDGAPPRFNVHSDGWALYSMVADAPRRAEVRLTAFQGSPPGPMGMFWGLHEDHSGNPPREAVPPPGMVPGRKPRPPVKLGFPNLYLARAVLLDTRPDQGGGADHAGVRLLELTLAHVDAERLYVRDIVELHETEIPLARQPSHTLQLELNDGILAGFRIDGVAVPLPSPPVDETTPSFASGALGTMCAGGQFVVTDLSLRHPR